MLYVAVFLQKQKATAGKHRFLQTDNLILFTSNFFCLYLLIVLSLSGQLQNFFIVWHLISSEYCLLIIIMFQLNYVRSLQSLFNYSEHTVIEVQCLWLLV